MLLLLSIGDSPDHKSREIPTLDGGFPYPLLYPGGRCHSEARRRNPSPPLRLRTCPSWGLIFHPGYYELLVEQLAEQIGAALKKLYRL
jgi:hypothetical protein